MSDKKGFSLLEALVAIAIFAFVMATTAAVFVSFQRAWRRQRTAISLVQNARWALEFMANEIRQGGNVDDNPGGIPPGRGVRFRPYPGPPTNFVCFWRGNSPSDGILPGDRTFLYRGVGNNIPMAYPTRQELANFIVDNPDLINNTTGFPPADGLTDPIFINNAGLLTIELTFRPEPSQPAGSENRNFTMRAQVRTRN